MSVTIEPPLALSHAARFALALIVMVLILKLIQQNAPRLVWPYVGIVLLGVAVYQREGVMQFLTTITQQIGGTA